MTLAPGCALCGSDGGEVIWRDGSARVVLADEPEFPGFVRVIWNAHVAEMTDLAEADRTRLMALVWCVEQAQRDLLRAHKVNLASLGNAVAHLHWHVIPRWRDDSHFPAPVWAGALRDGERRRQDTFADLSGYRVALGARLAEIPFGAVG